MATKKLSSKAKYIPNRLINEIEVERNGRTTTIDGADLLDGAYVKKNVKFAKGGGISQKVDKIASKSKPVALKHSGSPKEGYSVQVKDKTSGFTAWVDVWVDEEYNDVAWEWNKYIFNTDDDSDVLHSALQDNIIIAEEMSSVAILYLEDKGAIRQDNNAKWHYNKKFGNGGGVAISSESGLAVGTNADLLMNQQNLQYRKGGGVGEMIQTNGNSGWIYANSGQGFNDLESAKNYADKLSNERVRQSELGGKEAVDVIVVKEHNGKYNVIYREKNYANPQPNLVERVYAKGTTLKRGEPITMFWGVWLKDGQGYGENGNTLYRAFAKEQQAKDFIENELEYAQQKIAYVQKGKMSPPPKQQGGDRTWLRYAKGGGINMDKHIWEGWTVGAFIEDLEIPFRYHAKFKSRDEVKEWAMSNQPYYKKYIKDVVDYYWDKNATKFGNGGGVAISSESGLAVGTNADLLMNQQNLQYRKGGGLKNKAKYIPNRLINEIEVERNGRTTTIDGADLLDGAYVKKNVKFAKGSTVNTLKPIKVKAYGMDKRIVSLTQKAIDFLQKKFPQYRGEEELDSTEPYWDMVDAVRENFDTDTPTKYGEIGEEIVRMYLDKENKYAKGSTVKSGSELPYYVYNHETNTIEKEFDNEIEAEEFATKFKNADVYINEKYAKGSTLKGGKIKTVAEAKKHFLKKNIKITKAYNPKYWIMHNYLFDDSGLMVTDRELVRYANKGFYDNGGGVGTPKYGNGGGVAISSESGLAVGTNADLLMNQQNLQYSYGGVIPNQKTDIKFDSYTAVGYAEGFIEAPSTEAEIEAWAYLIATRQAYSLQGWFGRQAESLIANGIIDRDGTINWEKVDSMSDDNYADGGNMSSGFNYSIGGL
jgi:hypothetical protein